MYPKNKSPTVQKKICTKNVCFKQLFGHASWTPLNQSWLENTEEKPGEEGGFVKSLGCGAGFAYFLPTDSHMHSPERSDQFREEEKNY